MMNTTNLQEKVDDMLPYPEAPLGFGGGLLLLIIWFFIMGVLFIVVFGSCLIRIPTNGTLNIDLGIWYSIAIMPVSAFFLAVFSRRSRVKIVLQFALYYTWIHGMIPMLLRFWGHKRTYFMSIEVTVMTFKEYCMFKHWQVNVLMILMTAITLSLSYYLVVSKRVKNTYRH